MSFFSVKNMEVGYGKSKVISKLSFEAEAGKITGIIGANGCGKTTLLKAICGILPHEGSCWLDERKLEELSAKQLAAICSYVPQRSGIMIDISALDVVLMGFNPKLKLLEYPTEAMKEEASRMLAHVGLIGKESMNYLHLSEGQKQLCIMARTLIAGSQLLLLDEPESALDFQFRYQILKILHDWVLEEKRAAVVTLHDPALALNYCDKLILLSQGEKVGELHPKTDAPDHMEKMLSMIYGEVSLQFCIGRNGKGQLVMLRETEM